MPSGCREMPFLSRNYFVVLNIYNLYPVFRKPVRSIRELKFFMSENMFSDI